MGQKCRPLPRLAFVVVILTAVVTLSRDVAQVEAIEVAVMQPENSHSYPDVDHTVKYLLRDRTGHAEKKLRKTWSFQVKSGNERSDGLVETFGSRKHALQLAGMGFDLLEVDEQGDGFSGSGYHNPTQLHEAFAALQKKHPGQAKIFDLTKEYKQPKTIEGRSIYAIKISDNVAKDESEPNVLLVSNHHARELITPELALYYAREMLGGYEKATKLEKGDVGEDNMSAEEVEEAQSTKKIVDENQTYIMWTMNPDGLNTVWKSNSWKRTNGRNVDLNRNYPIGWSASCGGSTNQGGETYRGRKPFSEPETKTMRAFQDNRNFKGDISTLMHSRCAQTMVTAPSCPRESTKDFRPSEMASPRR